jgi:hypothetical protein
MAKLPGDRIAIGEGFLPTSQQPRATVVRRDKGNLTVTAEDPAALRSLIASRMVSASEQPDGTFVVSQFACRNISHTGPISNPLTTEEFAALNGVSIRLVQQWCATARIPGARRVGRDYLIPGGSPRPTDPRRRS